jgi:hypothetical protein
MSRLESCPVCFAEVSGWQSTCPKCRYHPDVYYNRAQDDVALLFRLSAILPPAPATTAPAPGAPVAASVDGAPGWRG